MKSILFVNASLSAERSVSRQVAAELIADLQRQHPGAAVVERDLGRSPPPHVDFAFLGAAGKPAAERDAAQADAARLADTLIEEVEAADAIVLAVPLYNFSVPSPFKAWIDHVLRARRTFRYNADGSVAGLLGGRKVYVVSSRGGVYSEGPARGMDFLEPWLRTVLGFVGLDDVTFVPVEGQAVGPEAAARGLDRARRAVAALAPQPAAVAA